ncbi:MAG: metal-dependent transcriptional regulator [Acidobacteriota bacterium]|nr:metal-dependent transcriptional regulator [Acidobacteriota bacterium]
MNPLFALVILAVVAGLAVLVAWPDRGWLWRWRIGWRVLHRTRTEDALKHLFDCEYQGRQATHQSLVGVLRLGGRRSTELLARMERLGLIVSAEGGFRLTAEGRSEALRVIRIHRLWERYLADETGLEPERWHPEAERREHRTSPQQAEELSVRLGHPPFDPHGDPIPTREGDMPPRAGRPLTDFAAGDEVDVVHVEDEPATIYAQLVAEGVHPGMKLRVTSVAAERIRFEADLDEVVLAPIIAANIFAVPVADEASDGTSVAADATGSLSDVAVGEQALVVGFSRFCRGMERRRLLDLGLLPGTLVETKMASPSGDPVAYRVRGAVIALRRSQAEQIHVQQFQQEARA